MTRTIEAIVEDQARRWSLRRREKEEERRPVVALGRLHGALGDQLAERLARELRLDLFDQQLIHLVAEQAQLGDRVVAALDEKKREVLTDWLAGLSSRSYLSPVAYGQHLARVVGAIAQQGGAVIVGRGAHLLLGPEEALRVLVVAPVEARVRNVMDEERVDEREARRRVVEVEADRSAFLMKLYHSPFAEPTGFDLVVNTAALGLDGAVKVVAAAVAERHARRPAHAV
jgi:hypothetical protein